MTIFLTSLNPENAPVTLARAFFGLSNKLIQAKDILFNMLFKGNRAGAGHRTLSPLKPLVWLKSIGRLKLGQVIFSKLCFLFGRPVNIRGPLATKGLIINIIRIILPKKNKKL